MTDNAQTPAQKAFKTDLPAYDFLPSDPRRFAHLHQMMMAQRTHDWLSSFPVEREVGDWSPEPEKALFVDIGGGFGHQCVRLKAKYPNLLGRIILQDIPETISLVKPTEGVEAMAHNFYDPQPIEGRYPSQIKFTNSFHFKTHIFSLTNNSPGAKFYYLRNIIHDYPDEVCVKILQNIVPALNKDSRILLDDMVLSNYGVHWRATVKDITMMTLLAARERTKDQWYALLDRAGLKILDIHTYNPTTETSVVVAVPK